MKFDNGFHLLEKRKLFLEKNISKTDLIGLYNYHSIYTQRSIRKMRLKRHTNISLTILNCKLQYIYVNNDQLYFTSLTKDHLRTGSGFDK